MQNPLKAKNATAPTILHALIKHFLQNAYEFSREDESPRGFLPSELRKKRCGVAFGDLTRIQAHQVRTLKKKPKNNERQR